MNFSTLFEVHVEPMTKVSRAVSATNFVLVALFVSLMLGINCREVEHKLEAFIEELEFERDLLKFQVKDLERRAEKALLQNDKRLRRYYDEN